MEASIDLEIASRFALSQQYVSLSRFAVNGIVCRVHVTSFCSGWNHANGKNVRLPPVIPKK